MKGVAPNTISTLATGASPKARMKAMKQPDSITALANRAPPAFRMSIQLLRRVQISNGKIVASSRIDRQNDTSHAGRSMRRTIMPAVLNTAAAATAQATPMAPELSPEVRVFICKEVSIRSRRAPVHRFPGPAALSTALSVVGARPANAVGPPAVVRVGSVTAHQRACVLPDGRSHGRHPARHARPARGADGRTTAGRPDPWPHRLRGQRLYPERSPSPAQSRLRGAAPQRA